MNADITPMDADQFTIMDGNWRRSNVGGIEALISQHPIATRISSAFIGVISAFIGDSKDFRLP